MSRPKLDLPVDELVAAYDSGASTTQLAHDYGCSVQSIRSRLTAAGVEMRRSGAPRTNDAPTGRSARLVCCATEDERAAIIARAEAEGMTVSAYIGRALGLEG